MTKAPNSLGPPGPSAKPRADWRRDEYEMAIAGREAEIELLRREVIRLQDEARDLCRVTYDEAIADVDTRVTAQRKRHDLEVADLERRRLRAEQAEQHALGREREATKRADEAWRYVHCAVEADESRHVDSTDKRRARAHMILVAIIGATGSAIAGAVVNSYF